MKIDIEDKSLLKNIIQKELDKLKPLSETAPTLENGSLDIESFNKLAKVMEIKEKLVYVGVKNSRHLGDLGFVVGAMILDF